MYFERPLVRAYIDETGDRGTSGKAARYFAMVAVVIADEDDPALRQAIGLCRQRLAVPAGTALHWTEHVKRFPRRQFVAGRLAAVDGLVVSFVIVEKAAVPGADPIRGDQVAFYNYVSGLISTPGCCVPRWNLMSSGDSSTTICWLFGIRSADTRERAGGTGCR